MAGSSGTGDEQLGSNTCLGSEGRGLLWDYNILSRPTIDVSAFVFVTGTLESVWLSSVAGH